MDARYEIIITADKYQR